MPKSVKRVNQNKRLTRKQNGGTDPFAGTGFDTLPTNLNFTFSAPKKFVPSNTELVLNISGAKANISGATPAKGWNANAEFAKAKNSGSFCSSFNSSNTTALKKKLLEDDDWLENTAGHYKKLSGKSGCVYNSVKATG
jgi:hypothetical protein